MFSTKFETYFRAAYVAVLKAIEVISIRFVDHVIVANHLFHKTLIARSIPEVSSSIVLNHVDPDLFYRHARTRADDKFIVLFPGSLQWHQGVDLAIQAFGQVKRAVQNAEFHIYSGAGGDMKVALQQLVQRLDLEESVKFLGSVPLHEMAKVIANADLGIVPKRADSFGNEAYSTKIMEFMSQGVPVVVSRTKVDTFYFEEGVVHFFRPGDSQAMAEAMLDVVSNQDLRKSLVTRGYEYVERNNWSRKKSEYLSLVDSLSTERFDDIHPTRSAASPIRSSVNWQQSTSPVLERVGGLDIKLDESRGDPTGSAREAGKLTDAVVSLQKPSRETGQSE